MLRVMDSLKPWTPHQIAGRKQPLYYTAESLVILGHYNTPCGGCDTIGSARAVYDLIQSLDYWDTGRIVLCEGLLLSEDTRWSSKLLDLRCLFLTTPLERCLENIVSRRKAAGNDKPLSTTNTVNRVQVIERARVKLLEAGVRCIRCSADQAPRIILKMVARAACIE